MGAFIRDEACRTSSRLLDAARRQGRVEPVTAGSPPPVRQSDPARGGQKKKPPTGTWGLIREVVFHLSVGFPDMHPPAPVTPVAASCKPAAS
ncbi:hypothetical protein V3F56_06775 [Moorellaceae bacterium AZ2]